MVRASKAPFEERTAEKNRIRAVLSRAGQSCDGDLFSDYGRTFLEVLQLSTVDRGIIEAHMAAITALNERIRKLESTIQDVAEAGGRHVMAESIPGVSYFTGLLIKSKIGEIDRFPSADHLVSYAGLDPSVCESGDEEIRGVITKQGSVPLRWALVQCANVAVQHDKYLGNFYTISETAIATKCRAPPRPRRCSSPSSICLIERRCISPTSRHRSSHSSISPLSIVASESRTNRRHAAITTLSHHVFSA